MKNAINKTLLILMTTIFTYSVNGQQDAIVSRYMFNGMLINPAYTGSHEYGTFGGIFRKQWTGFNGAPMTSVVYGDLPFTKNNCGAGINIAYDKIGVTEQTDINLNYAYHLRLNKTSKLSFGLRANLTMYKASLPNLTVWDSNDPEFSTSLSKMIPNFGAGMYYYSNNYYLGFSVPELLNYDKETIMSVNPGILLKTVRHYYFTGGYVFNINEKFDIKPSMLFRYTHNAPMQADINVQLYFKRMFSFGCSYRSGDAVIFMTELLSVPNWRFGYAYDLSISKISKYNNGSHEVMVAYDLYKKGKKYFSFF